MVNAGICAQDSALHVASVIERRMLRRLQWQIAPRFGFLGRRLQQPENRLFETLQCTENARLVDAVSEHRPELREKFLRRAIQYVAVRGAGRVDVGQSVQTHQTPNAMTEWRYSRNLLGQRLAESGVGRVGAGRATGAKNGLPCDVLGPWNSDPRDAQFGGVTGFAAIRSLLHAEVAGIVHCQGAAWHRENRRRSVPVSARRPIFRNCSRSR